MRTTLGICLFLAIHSHAESIGLSSIAALVSTSTTAAPEGNTVDLDEQQLSTIASTCLTRQEHELLAGGMLRYRMARIFNWLLIPEAEEAIGLAELRAVAGFLKRGPWTAYREPMRDEIAAAPTVDAYFELREPRSKARSLDSWDFFEKNFPPAIDFLDARFPAIRAIYRRRFETIRHRHPEAEIDRNEVDQMIDEFIDISNRLRDVTGKLLSNTDCSRASRNGS